MNDSDDESDTEQREQIDNFISVIQKCNINVEIKAKLLEYLRESHDVKAATELYKVELKKQLEEKLQEANRQHRAHTSSVKSDDWDDNWEETFTSPTRQRSSTRAQEGETSGQPTATSTPIGTTPFVQQIEVSPIVPPRTPVSQDTNGRQMAALTDEDITNITNIVNQNAQKDDAKIRQFSGLQKEAVSWMEDYDYIALSNDWNDEKKIRKLGAYLTGSGREWYSLCIQGQNNLTWANVKTAFYKQFLPVDYETHLREIFRTRKQKLFEPSANYVVAMRSVLAKSGQTMTEKEAVEFILTNMLPDIRKELLLRKPETYAKLMEDANTIEFALKSSQESNDEDIKAVAKQLASVSYRRSKWTASQCYSTELPRTRPR